MLERLHQYFYSEPGRVTRLGRFGAQLGLLLLFSGAIGQFATGVINILPTLQRQSEATKMLADIYPSLPLWWVPESIFGLITALALVFVGIWLIACGRKIDRMLNG